MEEEHISQSNDGAWETLKSIARNCSRLLRLSFETTPGTTSLFFFLAFIIALIPVAGGYLFTLLLDKLQLAQMSPASIVSTGIIAILIARSAIYIIQDVLGFVFARTYLDHIFRYKLQSRITRDYYKKVMNLDIAQFEDSQIQNLVSKVRDMMIWRIPDYIRSISYLLGNVVTYISAFIVTLQFGWWAPILVTVATIPRLYSRMKFGNIQWSAWEGSAPMSRHLWYLSWIMHEKTAVREMRVAQTTKAIFKKFTDLQDHLYEINKKPLDTYLKALILPSVVEGVVILCIVLVFLPQTISGALSIGMFSLLITMLVQLNTNTAGVAWDLSSLYESNLYVDQYFKLLNIKSDIMMRSNSYVIDSVNPPQIEFRHVSFAYKGGAEILHDVSFVIKSGESVAFVGHNGAGKSTIIKLLCRFYDVTGGEILINGINIKDVDLDSWYQYLGTLFQEFVQYQFTIKENITLGSRGVGTQKDIEAAAKKAGAHEFILDLPKKYDQTLGEQHDDGVNLSGGQWQKLAIARAFYQQPQVLILDEPTSAIDAEAEYEIFNNLEKQYADKKSLILVSHRFSTVRNAEKIIVLEKGKVVESGTHGQLMKHNKLYARMFTTQAKGYH